MAEPAAIASAPPSGSPPWCLSAFTVATSTTALGVSPPTRQTMSKNFSIPMSAAEARLGDDDVAELERDAVGDERVVAVRDVRERAAVDEGRLALERLDEVRLDRLLEQHRHRARGLQLLGGHGLALVRRADRDRAEPRAQVVEVARDRDDRHHLGRGGDVEAGLARVAVRAPAEADHDVAQGAVVDVDAAPPRDRERVDAELVAVEQVSLEHRREQVVRGADRVDVAGEVEVHVLHRHDLRVARHRRPRP